MKPDLHVLIVNDSEEEASVLIQEIERGGYNPLYKRIDTPTAMENVWDKDKWELIIVDCSASHFSGIKTLEKLNKTDGGIPVILIFDATTSEAAITAMKAEDCDCIMKNDLSSLCPSIHRGIQRASERARYKTAAEVLSESDDKLRAIFESIADGISIVDPETRNIIDANKAVLEVCGYADKKEVIGRNGFDFVAPRDRDRAIKQMAKTFFEDKKDKSDLTEYSLIDKNGGEHAIEASSSILRDSEGKPVSLVTIMRDITRRRVSEQERFRYMKRQENLVAIAQTVSQTLELPDLLQKALTRVLEIMEVDAGVIFMLDVTALQLKLDAYKGVSDAFIASLGRIKLDENELGKILRWNDSTTRLEDALNEANISLVMKAVTQDKFQMFIIEPMLTRRRIHGMICIAGRSARQITPNDMELLKTMSNQISIALDNAYLYKDAEEKAKRLELITAISMIGSSSIGINSVFATFAQGVKKLVDFDQASIALIEGHNLKFVAVASSIQTEITAGHMVALRSTAMPWLQSNNRPNVENEIAKEKQFPIDKVHIKEGLRSAIRLPLFSQGEVFGAFSLLSRLPNNFGKREQEILQELTNQIAVGIENNRLFTELKKRKEDLESSNINLADKADYLEKSKAQLDLAYLNMAKTVVILSEARDHYSVNHSECVADLCQRISSGMVLPSAEIKQIEAAARLFGLSKAKVPEKILQKPGPLTPKEKAELQEHQIKALDLLRIPDSLSGIVPILESMHEHFDGEGYPNKLKGAQIPIGARILAVADAYIAMTSDRPYRPAMSDKQALDSLKQDVGKQWDPQVVTALLYVTRPSR
jgi:PAS domain S-box-containing protein